MENVIKICKIMCLGSRKVVTVSKAPATRKSFARSTKGDPDRARSLLFGCHLSIANAVLPTTLVRRLTKQVANMQSGTDDDRTGPERVIFTRTDVHPTNRLEAAPHDCARVHPLHHPRAFGESTEGEL